MPLPGQKPSVSPLAASHAATRAVIEGETTGVVPDLHPAIGSTGDSADPTGSGGSFVDPHGNLAGGDRGDPRELLGLGLPAVPHPSDGVPDLHLSAGAQALLNSIRAGEPVELDMKGSVKCESCGKKLKKKGEKHDCSSHMGQAVTIYQDLNLDQDTEIKDGLIWKAICKTGTLALSPGPGQMDMEQPLHLTADLFREIKRSVEERAFPYVTVPETHNNGVLENTGYVRAVDIRPSTDPADPPGTEVLWAAIDFTEPEVREKALRGSIADTSIGVKFNYRNKRTGKLYPAALEHVALTNQPWVDGLIPFGQGTMLSQGVIDAADEIETDWRGVFIDWPVGESDTEPEGNILPDASQSGTFPTMPEMKTQPTTVEEVLAAQQAQIEKLSSDLEAATQALSLSQSVTERTGKELHEARVEKKIKGFEGKVPPATLVAAKTIMLADYRPNGEPEGASLKLSVQKDGEVTEQTLGATEIVETLLASLPESNQGDVTSLILDLDGLASKKPEAVDQVDPKAIADEIEAGLGISEDE